MFGRKYRIEDSPEFQQLINQLRELLRAYHQEKSNENLNKIKNTQENCRDLFLKGLKENQETDLWDDLDYLDSLIDIKNRQNKKNYLFKKYLRQKIISLIKEKNKTLTLKGENAKNKIKLAIGLIEYGSHGRANGFMLTFFVSAAMLLFLAVGIAFLAMSAVAFPIAFGILVAGIAMLLLDIGVFSYFRASVVEARQKAREEEYDLHLLDTQRQITQLKKIEQNLVNTDTKSANDLDQKNHLLNSPELDKAAVEKAKKLNHFLHQIKMEFVDVSGIYKCCIDINSFDLVKSYPVLLEEVTGHKINIIQSDDKNNVYLFLDKNSVEKINAHLADALNPAKILGDDYFIKSIRSDNRDFFSASFMWTVTRSLLQKIKFIFRPSEKGDYRADGEAVQTVIPKEEDIVPDKYNIDNPFSQTQSTSYIVAKSPSSIFGHDRAVTKLSGMVGKISDMYFSDYNSFYDAGTVNRPHHFQSKAKAEEFYEKKVLALNPYEKIIYGLNELDEFLIMLADPQKPVHERGNYNEVLAGIRWNTDGSSMLIIGTDDLETRLLTQYRAKILKERLIKQAKENNQTLDPDYEAPIIYYLPNHPNHLKYYTIFEQKKDLFEAQKIALSKDSRREKYAINNFEFLLMLDEDNIEKIMKEDGEILLKAIFDLNRLSILVPLMKKLSKDRLIKLMNDYEFNKSLRNLIKNHTHNYYPDLVELLFDLYKKQENPETFIIKTILTISLFQIEAPDQINDIISEKIKDLPNIKNSQGWYVQNMFEKFFKSLLAAGNTKTLSAIMNCESMKAFLATHENRIKINEITNHNYALLLNNDFFNNLSEELTKQAWFYAIENKDLKMVKKLWREKTAVIKIDIPNHQNQSALKSLLKNVDRSAMFKIDKYFKNDTCWKMIKFFIQNDADLRCLNDEEREYVSFVARRLGDTKIVTQLVKNDKCAELIMIEFLITHKKYKNFKILMKRISANNNEKESFLKINQENSDKIYGTDTHVKITAYFCCFKFLNNLNTHDPEKFTKISLHSIKDIDLDMLDVIFKTLQFESKNSLAIKWAFHIIRDPKISKNDSELLNITQDINFDKMRAYKTLKNIVALIGQGSPEEKESFLRKIQFLHECVQYKAPIVGHFKPKVWEPKPISNTSPAPQISNAPG